MKERNKTPSEFIQKFGPVISQIKLLSTLGFVALYVACSSSFLSMSDNKYSMDFQKLNSLTGKLRL